METLTTALAFVGAMFLLVGLGAAAVGGWGYWRDRRREPERMVECHRCHRELPARKAVVVASNVQHFEFGGSAMVAEYCKKHAP